MEYKEQVKIITDIEANVSVDELFYKNTKIWPVIRLEIWKSIFDGHSNPKPIRSKVSFLKRSLRFVNNRFFTKKNQYQKADVVFLIAPDERKVLVNDKYYSPFSSSLNDLSEEGGISSAILDLSRKRLPVFGKTFFIDKEAVDSPYKDKIFKLIKKIRPKNKNLITKWEELVSYMKTRCPGHIPDQHRIINYCEEIIRYENIFTRILKKIQPKTAFLVCYYHPAAMGYIKACRNLKIKTVEIQHGDIYGMYRDWTKLPAGGYELLPSSWWCWGKDSADKINEWSKPIHPEHKAFVGGNPWIARFIGTSPNINNRPDRKTNILIALTNMDYPVDNIVSAVEQSSDRFNWLIRPHPAMPDQVNKFFEVSQKLTKDNSSLLFEALNKVDFVVTPCSAVVYEALVFRVHPVITHSDGKNKFEKYIQKGLVSYAESCEKLLEILQKNESEFIFEDDSPLMETDQKRMREILQNLI